MNDSAWLLIVREINGPAIRFFGPYTTKAGAILAEKKIPRANFVFSTVPLESPAVIEKAATRFEFKAILRSR